MSQTKSHFIVAGVAAIGAFAVFTALSAVQESKRVQREKKQQSELIMIRKYINQRFDTKKDSILSYIEAQEWNFFTHDQLIRFYDSFFAYCKKPSVGSIDRNIFYNMCHEDGLEDEEVLDKLYLFWTGGHSASVDFLHHMEMLNLMCNGTKEEQLSKLFYLYDLDGNGVITIDELQHMIKAFYPTRSITSVHESIHEIMDTAHVENDLQLNYEQFVNLSRNEDFHCRPDQGFNMKFLNRFGVLVTDIHERDF